MFRNGSSKATVLKRQAVYKYKHKPLKHFRFLRQSDQGRCYDNHLASYEVT